MSKVFENSQWRVTPTTLESTDPRVIPLGELLKLRGTDAEALYDWPLQTAEKSWVDVEAFIEAFTFAVDRNSVPADPARMARSVAEARAIANARLELEEKK